MKRCDLLVWSYVVLAFGLLVVTPRASRAEGFVDLTVGGAVTQDANGTQKKNTNAEYGVPVNNVVSIQHVTVSSSSTAREDFATSPSVGGRAGYWFESEPWFGLAATVSYFQPDVRPKGVENAERADLTVVPLSLLLMARASLLTTKEFPHGQLQPYIGVGPGLFISHVSGKLAPGEPDFSDTSTDLGLDFRLGLAWQFAAHFALFGEYAYTHVSPTFSSTHTESVNVPVPGGTINTDASVRRETETDIGTHRFLAGLSYRFW
jgi:opacity protein-like surface antigen